MKPNEKESFALYGLLIGGLLLLVMGVYIGKFYHNDFSGDPAHWGQIGDYFGGILNPLIGVVNIYVFWKLTQELASIESKNQENQRNFETKSLKRQTDFFYNQLRLQALSEFIIQKKKISFTPIGDIPSKYDLDELQSFLVNFTLKYSTIFKTLRDNNNFQDIYEAIGFVQDKKPEGISGILYMEVFRLHKKLENEILQTEEND
ncbi:MAG: hypothetical protein H7329_14695 [Opitutaceae bacterium]|nr:hypothetical protein [Cytophagales bacterium]